MSSLVSITHSSKLPKAMDGSKKAEREKGAWFLACVAVIFLVCSCVEASGPEKDENNDVVLSRFRDYLRIKTVHPNPNYYPVTEFILKQAKEIGLQVRLLEFVAGKPVTLLTWEGREPTLPSVLFNSHVDVVPAEESKWTYPPYSAHADENGNIFARGSQDMKCVGMQYLEAARRLKKTGFEPLRTIHLSFVPDEEIGGKEGAKKFASSPEFRDLNVAIVLDEGLASPEDHYRVFNGERSSRWVVAKAVGRPGHGSKLYDNSALDNLRKVMNRFSEFRESQFDLVKNGLAAEGEVISINNVFVKAGTPTDKGYAMNVQPSEAEAGYDIRVPPTGDLRALEDLLDEEWAAGLNITYHSLNNLERLDKHGAPSISIADNTNPWWTLLKVAVSKSGGKLGNPEIFPACTDARFVRFEGVQAFGFSPMANTPILLHDHNEFLNSAEYIKGITVYEEIFQMYSTFNDHETGHPDEASVPHFEGVDSSFEPVHSEL